MTSDYHAAALSDDEAVVWPVAAVTQLTVIFQWGNRAARSATSPGSLTIMGVSMQRVLSLVRQ